MINYAEILAKQPNGVLATLEGQAIKTRVFQFLFAEGNKAYFCTGSGKPVYDQLKANPTVSFCSQGEFSPVLSINGKAVFANTMELKQRAFDENPMLATIYNSPENPIFNIFYIQVEEVATFGFAEGPKVYKVSL
ncbi:MAG: pyridoxamine 5-phosphate oxidase [Defluviitaleaceae bacterium]|nr:pyridoxamine 5-phosphate oxidase [Defluviitaleaceae bacterium]